MLTGLADNAGWLDEPQRREIRPDGARDVGRCKMPGVADGAGAQAG